MSTTPHNIFQRSAAPVTIDEDKCIADKGSITRLCCNLS